MNCREIILLSSSSAFTGHYKSSASTKVFFFSASPKSKQNTDLVWSNYKRKFKTKLTTTSLWCTDPENSDKRERYIYICKRLREWCWERRAVDRCITFENVFFDLLSSFFGEHNLNTFLEFGNWSTRKEWWWWYQISSLLRLLSNLWVDFLNFRYIQTTNHNCIYQVFS